MPSTPPLVSCFHQCYGCWCQVFLEVGIELEKRVKSVLLLCFAFFTLLFSSIGLFDDGLGRKGAIGLAGSAPE